MEKLEHEIRAALGRVVDPELGRDLVDLGMVRAVSVDNGVVAVTLALTIPGCPMKDKIRADVEREVGAVSGVDTIDVAMETMTATEKEALTAKLGRQPKPLSIGATTEVIGVASGKGGVGKSTVSVNLAVALAQDGYKVGLLDADIWGFSVPRMLGIDERPRVEDKVMIPPEQHGVKLMSTGFFVPEDQPVVWRGPLVHRAVEQFLTEVAWGDLDYLILDLPPGTGDVTITAAKLVTRLKLVMVTTPQSVASKVAVRAGHMAHKVGVAVVGVIENMSYSICDHCGKDNYLFGQGGGAELAEALGTQLIGQIPFDPLGRMSGDNGLPVVLAEPEAPSAQALREIATVLKEV